MIGRKLVTLDTYKYYGPKRQPADGESKKVQIPKDWLAEKIAPQSLEEFVDEYTWDDAEYWHNQYIKELHSKTFNV